MLLFYYLGQADFLWGKKLFMSTFLMDRGSKKPVANQIIKKGNTNKHSIALGKQNLSQSYLTEGKAQNQFFA